MSFIPVADVKHCSCMPGNNISPLPLVNAIKVIGFHLAASSLSATRETVDNHKKIHKGL